MNKDIIEDANFITIDVSFISVTKLIDKISELSNIKEIVCLIKPQFECGKEIADRFKGIILDKQVHKEVIMKVLNAFDSIGYKCKGLTFSPIKGGDGNIEYLAYLSKEELKEKDIVSELIIDNVIKEV